MHWTTEEAVLFPAGETDFPLLHSYWTVSVACPASWPVATEGSITESDVWRLETDCQLDLVPGVRMLGNLLSLTLSWHGVWICSWKDSLLLYINSVEATCFYADMSGITRTAFKNYVMLYFLKQSRIKSVSRQNYGNDIPQICENIDLCVLFLSCHDCFLELIYWWFDRIFDYFVNPLITHHVEIFFRGLFKIV